MTEEEVRKRKAEMVRNTIIGVFMLFIFVFIVSFEASYFVELWDQFPNLKVFYIGDLVFYFIGILWNAIMRK